MFDIPPGVRVIWARPRPDLPAASNGADRIWIDPAHTQAEIRCMLAHELLHLEHKHVGHQPPAVEMEIRFEVARRLITIEQLRVAAAWASSRTELRDELHVTDMVLLDRLTCITDTELAQLRDATSHQHA